MVDEGQIAGIRAFTWLKVRRQSEAKPCNPPTPCSCDKIRAKLCISSFKMHWD